MKHLLFLSLPLILTSCGVYKSDFDCRPGKGIGCAPVGEVLDRIIEKEEGEDLFVKDQGSTLILRQQQEGTFAKSEKKYYLIQDDAGNYRLVQLKGKA